MQNFEVKFLKNEQKKNVKMKKSKKSYGTIFELIVRKDFSMHKKIKNGLLPI